MAQIWGTFQRFQFAELSVQLNLSDRHFTVSDGDSLISRIGYDRMRSPDFLAAPFLGYGGTSHIEGPAHPTPYQFRWQLGPLPEATYTTLYAIIQRSQATKTPIRFLDGLLSLGEVAPRTRARVGTYLETAQGLAWFFPIFDVWIDQPERDVRINGRHYLTLTAQEWSPITPVPTSADVSA